MPEPAEDLEIIDATEPADLQPKSARPDLVPFEDHQKWANDQAESFPRPNGLACKQCGHELLDLSAAVLCAIPPLRRVLCETCRWSGHRLVIG